MMSKLRIWRVQPISNTGVKAPYFFVETEEFKVEKATLAAEKKAKEFCVLSKFDNWSFQITRMKVRKDAFGRYWKHHQ